MFRDTGSGWSCCQDLPRLQWLIKFLIWAHLKNFYDELSSVVLSRLQRGVLNSIQERVHSTHFFFWEKSTKDLPPHSVTTPIFKFLNLGHQSQWCPTPGPSGRDCRDCWQNLFCLFDLVTEHLIVIVHDIFVRGLVHDLVDHYQYHVSEGVGVWVKINFWKLSRPWENLINSSRTLCLLCIILLRWHFFHCLSSFLFYCDSKIIRSPVYFPISSSGSLDTTSSHSSVVIGLVEVSCQKILIHQDFYHDQPSVWESRKSLSW
jgi:hypothetical protein